MCEGCIFFYKNISVTVLPISPAGRKKVPMPFFAVILRKKKAWARKFGKRENSFDASN